MAASRCVGKAARELARAAAKRRNKIGADFAARHPARAREERALRKAQARLQDDWGHKRAATPETLEKASRVRQGALARLCLSGSISVDQLAWSAEIRTVHDRIGRDVAIGTVSLETRVDQSGRFGEVFFERLGAVRAEVAYTQWRAALPAPGPVLAMIAQDMACSTAARRFRRDTRTMRALLIQALDAWPDFQRDACDAVDEDELARAHSRLS